MDVPAKGAAATRLKCAFKPVPAELRETTGIDKGGVYLDRVDPGPLHKAGVRSGDLVLAVDDLNVDSIELLNKLVGGWKKGDEKTLLIMRGADDIRVLNVTVDEE